MKIKLEITANQVEALARVVREDPDASAMDREVAAEITHRLRIGVQRAGRSLPTYTVRACETNQVLYSGPAKHSSDALDEMSIAQGFLHHADALARCGGEFLLVQFLVRGEVVEGGRFNIPRKCIAAAEKSH